MQLNAGVGGKECGRGRGTIHFTTTIRMDCGESGGTGGETGRVAEPLGAQCSLPTGRKVVQY